jgi:hypothetical protein
MTAVTTMTMKMMSNNILSCGNTSLSLISIHYDFEKYVAEQCSFAMTFAPPTLQTAHHEQEVQK